MLCAVHLLDGTTENVALDKHAKGSCLLKEVCRRTKLTPEMDYFGLRFLNKSGQEQWLNLRNQIRIQMSKSQIYHLSFRVKYFVKQSQIFLRETKHQFFLDVSRNLSQGKYMLTRDKCSRFAALVLRREHGEDALNEISKYPLLIRDWNPQVDIEALGRLRSEHAQLRGICGIKAEERLLSELENEEQTYGAEMFSAFNFLKERVIIAVCVDALRIYDNKDGGLIDEYKYSTGLYPSIKGSSFIVEIEENYHCYKITYKLENKTAAQSLYRSTVEFCTFFTQEKVYDWVLDAKTTKKNLMFFGAVFKRKNARKQKVYGFDILRTAPEAFGNAWRLLAEEKAKTIQIACGLNTPKIIEQKAFIFGPDTPKYSPSNLVFDFSRPASKLRSRSRSGYLTPTIPSVMVDAPPLCYSPSNLVSDFSRPASKLRSRSRSGYLTPTNPPVMADAPPSPLTPRLPLTPGLLLEVPDTFLRLAAPLPRGMSQRDLSPVPITSGTFRRQTMLSTREASQLNTLFSSVSQTSLTSETRQQFYTPPASPNLDQSMRDIVTQLKASSSAQKEKKTFQARFLCKYCRKAYKNCSFVPCGHVVACVNCALNCDKCSECQTDVKSTTPVRYP